jgi:hypothetical protein
MPFMHSISLGTVEKPEKTQMLHGTTSTQMLHGTISTRKMQYPLLLWHKMARVKCSSEYHESESAKMPSYEQHGFGNNAVDIIQIPEEKL